MRRRTKNAAVRLEAVPEPPVSKHPPGGYDERTIAEALEVVRHQTRVLEIRSRVAAASGGLAPIRPPALASVASLGRAAREIELEEATAAIRDAQAALD